MTRLGVGSHRLSEKQPPEKLLVQGRKGQAGEGKLIGLNDDGR